LTFKRLLFNFVILTNTTWMSHLKFTDYVIGLYIYCVLILSVAEEGSKTPSGSAW